MVQPSKKSPVNPAGTFFSIKLEKMPAKKGPTFGEALDLIKRDKVINSLKSKTIDELLALRERLVGKKFIITRGIRAVEFGTIIKPLTKQRRPNKKEDQSKEYAKLRRIIIALSAIDELLTTIKEKFKQRT